MAAAAAKSGTRPPWVGLGVTVWVQIAAGNAYNCPLYSHSLKSFLGYSQQQLTMLSVANDIGENFGGFCSRLPPWLILCVGAAFCFLGYDVLWLTVIGSLSLPYWLDMTLARPKRRYYHVYQRRRRRAAVTWF